MLNVKNFLWKVFSFAVRIEAKVGHIKTKAVQPLFGGEKFVDGAESIDPQLVVRLNPPYFKVAIIATTCNIVLVVECCRFRLIFEALRDRHSYKGEVTYEFSMSIENDMKGTSQAIFLTIYSEKMDIEAEIGSDKQVFLREREQSNKTKLIALAFTFWD